MKLHAVMITLLLLVLTGCGPATVREAPPAQPEDRAEALYRSGQFEQAGEAWLALASDFPERADGFRLRAAEAWLLAGDREGAEALLDRIDPEGLTREQRRTLELAQVELALARGDYRQAEALLAGLPEELDAGLEMRRIDLERRLSESRLDRAEEGTRALIDALETGDFEPELALALLIEIPTAELEGLLFAYAQDDRVRPWLDLATTARRGLLDDRALIAGLERWEDRNPALGYSAIEALDWIRTWKETVDRPVRIAVLLPGRGPLAQPGQALRSGLVSRWLEIPEDIRPRLDFHELGEGSDAAVSAWFQAREDGADFIIGPLDRSHVDALMELTEPAVPILFLNQPEEAEESTGGMRYFLALPPEAEAEDAAVHALASGHRRSLLMVQDSSWGRRLGRSFTETFEAGGGRVLGRIYYQPDQSDHSVQLEEALGLGQSEQRARQLQSVLGTPIESAPSRRTDVDLMFLASRAGEAHQIKPQLRFFEAGDLPLYATSHVYGGQANPGRDQDLDGTELPIAPWFLDSTPQGRVRQQATDRFSGLSNPTLSQLHALGRDAIALVPWLVFMAEDPELYLAGATGRLLVTRGGRVDRELKWARFENGRLVAN